MARDSGERITLTQISQDSGISFRTVQRISAMNSWSRVSIKDIDKFASACKVDLLNQAMAMKYLKKTASAVRPFAHLPKDRFNVFNRRAAAFAVKAVPV